MNQPIVGLAQHIGKRKEQQDTVRKTPVIPSRGLGVFLADGIGGHPGGATASLLAVRAARASFLGAGNTDDMFAQANSAVLDGHQRVWNGQRYPEMGTTLVTFAWYVPPHKVAVPGPIWAVGSVGDSRAYLLAQNGAFSQITRDESVGSVLMQWIGMPAHLTPKAQVVHHAAVKGQVVLLCSDGLSNVVAKNDLESHLAAVRDGRGTSQEIAQALVNAAVRARGSDNITAAVIAV